MMATGTNLPNIHRCKPFKSCTLEDFGIKKLDGTPMAFCHVNCPGYKKAVSWDDKPGTKVLWLMNDFAQGGLARYTKDLADLLVTTDVQLIVLYETDYRTDTATKEAMPCPIALYSRELYERLLIDADVVTTSGVNTFTADRDYMLQRASRRLLSQVHGTCEYSKNLIKLNQPYAKKWVAVSQAVRQLLPADVDVAVVRPPVNFDRCKRHTVKEEAKKRLGLQDKRVVTIASRLSPDKGHEKIAHIVKDLPEDIVLLVVGEGHAEDTVIPAVKNILSDRAYFLPWQNYPYNYLDVTDCFICMSENEGGPLTVIESLLHGTPVVSLPVGIVPELFTNGQPSVTYYQEPADIVRAMSTPIEKLQTISAATAELVDQEDVKHSWVSLFEETKSIATNPRQKYRFAYFTGTNRPHEKTMIDTMIASARKAGVLEDFHVFSPMVIDDAIHHAIPEKRPWNMHMAKIEFLLDLQHLDYEYFVWLDTDNYFVRDPGDLKELIRNEPCWVSMEGDFTSPDVKFKEWYGLFVRTLPAPPLPGDKMSPTVCEVYKQFGAKYCRNTNGGMFICRREAIPEFYQRTFHVFNTLHQNGFHSIPDEPPLAIVGDIMVSDPLQNTPDKHSHIWACDWHSTFKHKLPDGQPWLSKEWLTQTPGPMINPAIIHCMRSKELLNNNKPFAWEVAPQEPILRATENVQKRLSIGERLASFAAVSAATALDSGKMLPQEVIDSRLTICASCEHNKNNACELCGCQTTRQQTWMNKLAHATAVCPAKPPKWGKHEESHQ